MGPSRVFWPSRATPNLVRRRLVKLLASLALLAVAVLAGQAQAAVHIASHPVDVMTASAGDSTGPGGLQARFDSETNGQFAPPTADATIAGLHLAVFNFPSAGQTTLFGPTDPTSLPQSTPFSNGLNGPVAGSGTPADPFKIDSTYSASGTGLNLGVFQELLYQTGANAFIAQYTITNNGTSSVTFRPTVAAPLYLSGGATGYGVFVPGPPRLVSAVNDIIGDGDAIQDASALSSLAVPFSNYQEGESSALYAAIGSASDLGNSVNPAMVTPGVGVQFPDKTLAPTASVVYTVAFIVGGVDGMVLSPPSALAVPGANATVTATVLNHTKPAAGRAVRYTITGPNPSSGTVTSDASGLANITWAGNNLGTDTVTAYVDSNGDGVRESNEVMRTATVTWRLPVPVFGKSANLTPVSGNVSVIPPKGKKFKVNGPRNIPVGSVVNVNNGVAKLVTSRSPRGGTQAGNFFGGTFQIVQKKKHRKGRRPPTDLRLRGGKVVTCKIITKHRGKKATIARKRRVRRRHLWGNAHGHYRTVGQNSAAEVRGTKWEVKDTCAGTLTVVRRGTVVVIDFVHHKRVIVKKGHRYLARFK
jgi:hypothetical protein